MEHMPNLYNLIVWTIPQKPVVVLLTSLQVYFSNILEISAVMAISHTWNLQMTDINLGYRLVDRSEIPVELLALASYTILNQVVVEDSLCTPYIGR